VLEEWLTAKTVDCEEYARQVAEDHHLAAEFAQLSAVNDTTGALQVVIDAAADILGYCVQVSTPKDQSLSLLLSVRAIEQVAERSGAQGDEIQCAWCTLLHHRLLGGARPSA
jgi:hypothetical protein